MSKIKMDLVLPPYPTGIILMSVTPMMKGDGDTDYACANCDVVLIEGAYVGANRNLYLKCPRCSAVNWLGSDKAN